MATTASGPAVPAGPHDIVCPDPSAHKRLNKDSKLPEKAAEAALYITHPEDATNVRSKINPLDADGKLSSASAATSLKYAKAHELPSFPVVGIDKTKSSGSAATLAFANQKPFEHWKPGKIDHANQAAMLAKDYKMAPLWQPEASAAGSKAAMLAHTGPGRDWWQPEPSKNGGSAAEIAMRTKGLSPEAYGGVGEKEKRNALLAASTSVKGRQRSDSTPSAPLYPDQHNAELNAFSAATSAHGERPSSRAMEASRITHLSKSVNPKMFTEQPPIAWEQDEKKHQDSLQASAIAMAKQMYAMQKIDDEGNITINHDEVAARAAHGRQPSTGPTDLQAQAMQYIHLQEAAQKLAAERLAKLSNPDESAAFRSYYGYPEKSKSNRLSMGSRSGRRASSAGASSRDIDSDDEEQAARIRGRQSQLNSSLAQVDKQRDDDRKRLMAVAEKRVHAQMTAMDRRVYDQTGKMSPALVEEWDAKARAKAAAASETRMQNHGKIDIGGGKFMDRSEIEAIAAARVKPTLDQINETAENQRAHDETVRLENEQRKRQLTNEKAREAESRAEQKRTRAMEKEEAKHKRDVEKQAARAEKDAEKSRKVEEKRLAEEEKRRSKEVKHVAAAGAATSAAEHQGGPSTTSAVSTRQDEPADEDELSSEEEEDEVVPTEAAIHDVPAEVPVVPQPETTAVASVPRPAAISKGPEVPESTSSTTAKPKRFSTILNKLKLKSKDSKTVEKETVKPSTTTTKSTTSATTPATTAAVAGAGGVGMTGIIAAAQEDDVAQHQTVERPGSVSSVSSLEEEADDGLYTEPEPRGRTRSRASISTADYEEARDTLAPPPAPVFTSAKGNESPNKESKFHEEV